MNRDLTLDEMRTILNQVEAEFDPFPETNEFIEVYTHTDLDEQECKEIQEWFVKLPDTVWTPEDSDAAFEHLLISRQAIAVLPKRLVDQAIYFKLKWG